MLPQLQNILDAYCSIQPFINCTPVLTSSAIDHLLNGRFFFKCENFQKTGSFKFRGATNAVMALSPEQARKGVATHSSGNFAAALARAAKDRSIKSFVVMPDNSPEIKKKATAGYGAEITWCKPTLQARETTLENIISNTGATFIHPYNQFEIISGQGTAALEFLREINDLDIIIAPVGGGGLLSGTAIAAKSLRPDIKVIAAEPQNADDAFRSINAGHIVPSENPKTIADGLLTSLGDLTFECIRENVDEIVTVSEKSIVDAMRLVWERMKIIIEPSSAVPMAAILENKINAQGRKTGIILSGGNVELSVLPF